MSRLIPVWIDTDTGVDDAVALLCAFQLDHLLIKGISAVAGNVGHDRTFVNARNVCSLAKKEDIKVYPGAHKPLMIDLQDAAFVHGKDGLGGAIIPESKAIVEEKKAWDALYEAALEAKGNLEIVAVGPLTNIAISLYKHPDLTQYVKRILIMGGAAMGGNCTPCSEFNIHTDPHAAETVFKCGIPIVMFGLDVTMKAYLEVEEVQKMAQDKTAVSEFYLKSTKSNIDLYTRYYRPMLCLHDVCPVLYLKYPDLFTGKKAGVYVETQGEISFGKTVTDLWSDAKFPKRQTLVILDVKRNQFRDVVAKLLAKYK